MAGQQDPYFIVQRDVNDTVRCMLGRLSMGLEPASLLPIWRLGETGAPYPPRS